VFAVASLAASAMMATLFGQQLGQTETNFWIFVFVDVVGQTDDPAL
jgi:hypothetical protein